MYSRLEILRVIKLLQQGEGDEDQVAEWFSNELSEFMPGISDLIIYSKEKLTPEEILVKAMEQNKPILL